MQKFIIIFSNVCGDQHLILLYMQKFYCLISFILLLFTSCSSTQRPDNCGNFKQGKFRLTSRIDNSYTIIERRDSIQTETNLKTGHIVIAIVNWTNPCEYELQYQIQTKNSDDTIISFLQSKPLKTKIIKATKGYCIFEAQVDSIDHTYVDTLWRL